MPISSLWPLPRGWFVSFDQGICIDAMPTAIAEHRAILEGCV
jgi:hypothetical protein